MRKHTKFGIKIVEIDFVIKIVISDRLAPPQCPTGQGKTNVLFAHPIHVSNSHTKFGWISLISLGGDSIMD